MKFYVSWLQDGGYGGVAYCHAVIEAPDKNYAHNNWFDLVRGTGVGAATYSSDQRYQQLFAVRSSLQDKSNAEILEYYRDT